MLYWARLYTWSVWLFYARTLHWLLSQKNDLEINFSSCLQWTFHLAVCLKLKSFWYSYATRIHLYTRFWRLKRDLFAFDPLLPAHALLFLNIVCNHLSLPNQSFFFCFFFLISSFIRTYTLHTRACIIPEF